MARIEGVRIRETVRPLKIPFATSLGQKKYLHNVTVQVVLEGGASGWGEVPMSYAYPAETLEAIKGVLSEARAKIRGRPIGEYEALIEALRGNFPRAVMTASGLEVALFRAFLNEQGLSEYDHWGRASTRIETDITLPNISDETLLTRWLEWAIGQGFHTFKQKVGGDPKKDRTLLRLVYPILSERLASFRLRLDGNQGYSAGGYLDFLSHLERAGYDIELFEQPLKKHDFRGYEAIRGKSRFPIVLDETVIGINDARRAIDNRLGDGINIKITKSGVGQSLQIAQMARRSGMKLMIGCMIETMVGLSAAILFALGTGYFDYVDLDSAHFLYGGKHYPNLSIKGPIISVRE